MDNRKPIENMADIEMLVNRFYDKVRVNPVIGYIFEDVAKVDWEHHLPKMYKFWASILLGEHHFEGNPMQVHVALSKRATMDEQAFNEWLRMFIATVDELFVGPKADEAKQRAASIARIMLFKIQTTA